MKMKINVQIFWLVLPINKYLPVVCVWMGGTSTPNNLGVQHSDMAVNRDRYCHLAFYLRMVFSTFLLGDN